MSVTALLELIASGDLSGQTRREAAVLAVQAVLSSIPGLTVLRADPAAISVARAPLVVVQEGAAQEQDEPTIGFVSRHFDMPVDLFFFAENETGDADRTRAALDAWVAAGAAALDADRKLGGLIIDLLIEPVRDMEDEAPDGLNEAAVAVLPVTLMYSTGRNPEEVLP